MLPIKRFARAKTRLLDEDLRASLAPAMAADVLDALTGLDVIVVSGEPAVREQVDALGFELLEDPDDGHSEAALRGIDRAARRGAASVALVAGDCPLIDPDDLVAGEAGVVLFADRLASGTNGIILTPPRAMPPAFGAASLERHRRMARDAGLPCAVRFDSSLALDADTPADLAALRSALREHPGRAERTRELVL